MSKSAAAYHGQPGTREHQCEAKLRNKDKRCGNAAMPGSNVCKFHGAAAPQTKQAARVRLAALVDPAIAKLAAAVQAKVNSRHFTTQQQIAAARDILDRNGLKSKDEIVVTAEFDASRFRDFSDDDLRTYIALARRASSLRDATDTATEGA
jgi:hypothetical protein